MYVERHAVTHADAQSRRVYITNSDAVGLRICICEPVNAYQWVSIAVPVAERVGDAKGKPYAASQPFNECFHESFWDAEWVPECEPEPDPHFLRQRNPQLEPIAQLNGDAQL